MTSYRLTPAARQDLSSIWDYTTENWGPQQAETYLIEIKVAFERIAEARDAPDTVPPLTDLFSSI